MNAQLAVLVLAARVNDALFADNKSVERAARYIDDFLIFQGLDNFRSNLLGV